MANAQKERKTRANWPLAIGIFLVIAALAYVVAATPFGIPARQALGMRTPLEVTGREFAKEYANNFITYTDPDYGFSFDYPIGYEVAQGTGGDAKVFITASAPEGDTESFIANVAPGQFTDADFNELKDAYDPQYVTLAKQTQINGRRAFLLYVNGPDELTGANFLMRQAGIACTAPDGSGYTAIFTAMVPETLGAETATADYMISTLKC